jgi:hypothetical protein
MYCANDFPFHDATSVGVAPNDADSRNRATSALLLREPDTDLVVSTYLLPGGIVEVQVPPLHVHSGKEAVKVPPARSQSFPSYDRATGMNNPLSISSVKVHSDPIPLVFEIVTFVALVILIGGCFDTVLGQVRDNS